jgi:endoglucanase
VVQSSVAIVSAQLRFDELMSHALDGLSIAMMLFLVALVILCARVAGPASAQTQPAAVAPLEPRDLPAALAYVRVNQVGYVADGRKTAVLMANRQETGATFSIIDAANGQTLSTAAITARPGKWNPSFGFTYRIDFSSFTTAGTYTIAVNGPAGATSPSFKIAPANAIYPMLVVNASAFYAAQHDVHASDSSATVYDTPTFNGNSIKSAPTAVGGPIDVSGGFYDAGDYLEFVETTSYADAALLLTARDHPGSPVLAEAKRGLQWLLKMWDPKTKTLYYQVGVGDGNKTIHGDHDVWRLPAADNALNVGPGDADYFLEHRPVFRARPAGTPVSPNLAGRMAAAFALGQQVFANSDPALAAQCLNSAKTILAAAQTQEVKKLLTAAPFAYYPETEWRDDMEWGATELYNATGDASFLEAAAHWAKAYLDRPDGGDVPNLYDVGALAHYELANAITKANAPAGLEVSRSDLTSAMNQQLAAAVARSTKDSFGLGLPFDTGDLTPHVIGLALEASLYDELTHTSTYASLQAAEVRWILGGNPWGVSFIVGAGTTYPQHLQHQIANLTGITLTGAVVDGPNDAKDVAKTLKDLPEGSRPGPADGTDPYKIFSARGVRFADNVAAYPCTEPAIDYAALTPLLFSRNP